MTLDIRGFQERTRLYQEWQHAWDEYSRVRGLVGETPGLNIAVPLRPARSEDILFQELKRVECEESIAWRAYEAYLRAAGLLRHQDESRIPNPDDD